MGYKRYSDAFKTEAVIRLAVNRYDYDKTAEQTGVAAKTLRVWEKDVPKKGIPEMLERAVERMLMVIPSDMKAKDWGITLGILMDKWLLMQGEPTQRTENVISQFQALSDRERSEVISDAERILAGLSSNGSGPGSKKA